jgi:hypothetical protein
MSIKNYFQYVKYIKEQDETQSQPQTLQTQPQSETDGFVDSGDAVSKLNAFILGKTKEIKNWFKNGEFGNSSLYEIDHNVYSGKLTKTIIFSFADDNFYYQIELTIRIKDYKDGAFNKAFLKIKKYNLVDNKEDINLDGLLIDEWDSNNPDNEQENGQIDMSKFNSKFILEIITKMEEEPNALGSNKKEETQGSQDDKGSEF